jgi:nuclease HARBI1
VCTQAKVYEHMQQLLQGTDFYVYGDSGFALQRTLLKPFPRKSGTMKDLEAQFNCEASGSRISVEMGFGSVLMSFPFLTVDAHFAIERSPIGLFYPVACILQNCITCLRGQSRPSIMFGADVPLLSEYLSNANRE